LCHRCFKFIEEDADKRDMELRSIRFSLTNPIQSRRSFQNPNFTMQSSNMSSGGCRFRLRFRSAFDPYSAASEAFSENHLALRILTL